MPALPPVANNLKVDFNWTVGDDTNALVRQHWKYSGGPPLAADLVYFATQFDGYMANMLASLGGATVKLTSVIVTDIASSSGAQGEFAGIDSGARAGSPLTAGSAAILNYHISRRGP